MTSDLMPPTFRNQPSARDQRPGEGFNNATPTPSLGTPRVGPGHALVPALRPYQQQVARAVLDSVRHRHGLTFTVEIARQGGKNEISAQIELLLLVAAMARGGDLIKAAPTFVPQALISRRRLTQRLDDAGLSSLWHSEGSHIIRLGQARQLFLSAAPTANVVGATARHLLELDEAQDIDRAKFQREFRPMGAASNVTTVLYGTPWDDATLLEEQKQLNLELERRDGVQRHFRFDWREVARHNPDYAAYVESERQRLGENHPLFRTQYDLFPIAGGGGFLSPSQQAQLQGRHPRRHTPRPGAVYVAGIDLAGEAEEPPQPGQQLLQRRDATVVTIGELDFAQADPLSRDPAVKVVEHYWWTGERHTDLYPRLVDLLRRVWQCRRVVVDATGVGEAMASFLQRALGAGRVVPFKFTAASKSRLAFDLLAAVNGGRLQLYAPDGSPEHHEFWRQIAACRSQFRPNRTLNFFVDPANGHDDFISSLALLVHAASYLPRTARGRPPD